MIKWMKKDNTWVHRKTVWKIDILDQILTLQYPIICDGKIKKGLSLDQACEKVWITAKTFYSRRRNDIVLDEKYNEIKEMRNDMMREKAKNNIFEAIDWTTKLRPKEKIEFSFRYLEKTSPEFVQKQNIELKTNNLNFDISQDELDKKIRELAKELDLENNLEEDEQFDI